MNESSNRKYKIALDAMGGNFAPINEVEGAILAYEQNTSGNDFEIVFVGNEKKILAALAKFKNTKLNYSILHTDEVVTMDDDPTDAIKKKRKSSLFKGIELHSKNEADAFVSAGNTGATLAIATILLGKVKGVSRPTISSFFPSEKLTPTLVLDVGANVGSKPRHIQEFAIMGSIYFSQIMGINKPRVGLLNIGEEPSKGTETAQQANELLHRSNINFIGNIEGSDILRNTVDVVVCDGFEGNIILKFAESIYGFIKVKVKDFANRNIINKVVTGLMSPFLKKIFSQFDYQQYGGVPLLGVNGVVIIGHGKSSPTAIKNMIYKAIESVKKDINSQIENALNTI